MQEFRVAEIFTSINGESARCGETAVFVRFTGCNLRCNYCDTLWALEDDAEYTSMNEDMIYEYIHNSGIRNVTLTGGEPLIQPGIESLISRLLQDKSLRVEIETNGAVDIRPFKRIAGESLLASEDKNTEGVTDDPAGRLSFTVDYKCPGSSVEQYMFLQNFEAVDEQDSVKFVVSDISDLDKMAEIVERYRLAEKTKVFIGAVFGRIDNKEIVKYLIDHKINDVKLQLQIHKYIWSPDRRGV